MTSAQALVVHEKARLHLVDVSIGLRAADWVILGFLVYAVVASLVFPLSYREQLLIGSLNLTAGGAVVLSRRMKRPSRLGSILRDWFPTVLILLAYRESGLFLRPDPTHRLDYLFVRWDRILLENGAVQSWLSISAPWLQRYLELSYLLCYPLVPLGFAALCLARRGIERARGNCLRPQAVTVAETHSTRLTDGKARLGCAPRVERVTDHFWTSVLLAVLSCYIVFPLFPLTPPRVMFHDLPGPAVEPLLRQANFWILNRYSVQACIFPSGHVAAATAVALALRTYLPRLGVLFLIMAMSIAAATVYGRYHYAADAVAGALVGVSAFLISRRIYKA